MASDTTTFALVLAVVLAGIVGYLLWLRSLTSGLRERAARIERRRR